MLPAADGSHGSPKALAAEEASGPALCFVLMQTATRIQVGVPIDQASKFSRGKECLPFVCDAPRLSCVW